MGQSVRTAFNLLLLGGLLGYALPAIFIAINLFRRRRVSRTYIYLANLFFCLAIGIGLLVIAVNQLPQAISFSLEEIQSAVDGTRSVELDVKIVRAEQTALITAAITRFRNAMILALIVMGLGAWPTIAHLLIVQRPHERDG